MESEKFQNVSETAVKGGLLFGRIANPRISNVLEFKLISTPSEKAPNVE